MDTQKCLCCFVLFVVLSARITASGNKCLRNNFYEHPTDCNKFYTCAPFGPVLMHCPVGLHFNPRYMVCDWPRNAGCENNYTESTGTNALRSCPIYPHPSECAKFYMCSPLDDVVMECPPSLHFNPYLLVCDWPYNAGCILNYTLTDIVGYTTIAPDSPNSKNNNSQISPTTLITTSSSQFTTSTTDNVQTTIFDETKISSTTISEILTPNGILLCESDIWPHPDDCSKFFKCGPTGAEEKRCPESLHFNPALLVCDWPYRAGCKSNIDMLTEITTANAATSILSTDVTELTTEQTDMSSTTISEILAISTANYPNKLTSENWSSDHPGIGTHSNAPSTFPDITTEVNTMQESTAELDTTSANIHEMTTILNANETILCESDIWPHPDDCSKFFKCGPTGAEEKRCPESLHFNPALLVCDWPYRAGCKSNIDMLTEITTANAATSIISTDVTELTTDQTDMSSTTISEILAISTANYPNELTSENWSSDHPGIGTHSNAPSTFPDITTEVNTMQESTAELDTTSANIHEMTTILNANETILCESDIWPHPDDCTKFFKCGSTGAEEKRCPESLHFNPELLVCDWPYRAGCKSNIDMLTEITTANAATSIISTDISEITTDHTEMSSTTISEILATSTADYLNELTSENWSSDHPGIGSHSNAPSTFPDITTEVNTMQESTAELETTSANIHEVTTILNANETILCESDIWPHPDDCTKFFKCGSTGAEEKRCPESLHFNPELLVCDWPYRAGCKSNIDMLTEITTANAATSIISTDISEITTDHTEMSSTTISEILATSTANDLNELTSENWSSDHPGIGSHSNAPSTFPDITTEVNTMQESTAELETTSANIHEVTTILNANETTLCESDIWPHPDDCTKFFKCGSTGAEEKRCPESLHFNPELLVCDWPYKAGCKSNIDMLTEITTANAATSIISTDVTELTTDQTDMSSTTISEILAISTANYPNELTSENWSSDHPGIGSHSNAPSTFPDITTEVNTMQESTAELETTSANIHEVTTILNANETTLCESDIWPHPDDCTKFFKCGSTGAEEKRCPESLHFNPELLVCDWPYKAGCKSNIDMLTEITTANAATSIISTDISEITTDHTEMSSTTISEILATSTANDLNELTSENWSSDHPGIGSHSNAPSTFPDITTEVNTMEESTTELETTSPSIHEVTTILIANETIPCESDIWPHPNDCTKFFKCGSTGAEEKRCPESLHFNPELLVCDWPYKAGCKSNIDMLTEITTANAATSIISTDVSELTTEQTERSSTTISEILATSTSNDLNELTSEDWSSNPPGIGSQSNAPSTFLDITTEVNTMQESTAELETTSDSIHEVTTILNANETTLCESDIWPHPDDCTKFFKCGSTGAVEKRCPESLHFNPELLVCDWPYQAGCKNYIHISTEITTANAATSIISTDVSELTTDQTEMSSTIISEILATSTANDLNELTSENWSSDHPEISSHSNAPSTFPDITTEVNTMQESTADLETTSASILEVTAIINVNKTVLCESDIWPHPDDCTKFFKCGSTGAVEKRCPESLHFNPELLVCDWPYQAGCKNYIHISTEITTANAATSIISTDVSELTTDQTEMSSTIISEILATSTANDLNELTSENWSSDHPEISSHSNAPSTFPDITTEVNTMQESTADLETTSASILEVTAIINVNKTVLCESDIWPHPDDCTKFFKCGSTGAVEKRCPESLHFNPELLVCDWPYQAGCKNYIHISTEITTANAATSIISTDVSELTTDQTEMSSTIISEILATSTANDLNELTSENWSSDHPEISSHSNAPSTFPDITTEVNTMQESTADLETTSASILEVTAIINVNKTVLCESDIWPHPDDCTKFFKCGSTGAVEKRCPESLHFNPELLVCDWPYRAGCKIYIHISTEITTANAATSIISTDVSELTTDQTEMSSTIISEILATSTANDLNELTSENWSSDHPEISSHSNAPSTFPDITTEVNTMQESTADLETTSASILEVTAIINVNKTVLCESDIWPHPDDCTKFFKCGATGAEEKRCPVSLHFNPELLVCDWTYRAGCKSFVGILPGITTDVPEPTTEQTDMFSTYIPETLATSKANDSNELPSENWSSDRPEISSNSNAPSTFLNITTEVNTMQESTIINVNGTILCESSIWPHPDDCSKFFMCGATGAEEKKCPESLYFNPVLLVCDWAYSTICTQGSTRV